MAHASFGTLPLELKARVVEMVADQEDAWRVRVKDIKKRVGHINCLSALALGNKELRDLAAKHQFKTLSSGKASRPVFRFTILRQYGHHITRVKLRGTKEGHLDDALAIMSQLPTGIMDPTKPALVAALDAQPVIRRVQLGESVRKYPLSTCTPIKDLATPSSLAAYADLVRSRNLDPSVLDRPHLTPFHPDANLDYTENEGAYLAEVLDRTLDFGRSELKRMVAEGRAASAVEWVEALKPLEDKRLAWKD
ncbi:hypothetical protein RQP46_002562 [Phenoliferia psychrophenolica]